MGLEEDVLRQAVKDSVPEIAELFYEELIHNIETNKYKLKLKPSTIARKIAGGSSTPDTPLMDKGDLISHIVISDGKVKYDDGTHYSGLSYKELGTILEKGRLDKSILPFPIWRYTLRDLRPRVKKIIGNRFKKLYLIALKKRL